MAHCIHKRYRAVRAFVKKKKRKERRTKRPEQNKRQNCVVSWPLLLVLLAHVFVYCLIRLIPPDRERENQVQASSDCPFRRFESARRRGFGVPNRRTNQRTRLDGWMNGAAFFSILIRGTGKRGRKDIAYAYGYVVYVLTVVMPLGPVAGKLTDTLVGHLFNRTISIWYGFDWICQPAWTPNSARYKKRVSTQLSHLVPGRQSDENFAKHTDSQHAIWVLYN